MASPQVDFLRPSPLDLGGVISGAARIVRERLGQFVVLALIPSALMAVLLVAALVPLLIGIFTSIAEFRFSGLVVVGVLLIFLAAVVGWLAQIKVQAMITLGAYDVIHRRPSSGGDLFRRTAGVIGRVILLLLLVVLAVFVVNAAILALAGLIVAGGIAAAGNNADPGAAIGTAVGAFLVAGLLMLAVGVLAFYLAVRFLYFLPGVAVENLRAVDALKRSWALTRGNFLRTLGYYLIASLLVSLASYLVSLVGQLMWLPAASTVESSVSDPTAAMLAMLPAVIVTTALSFAVQVLALPFLTSYVTVMYVDQLRRNELPPGWRPGMLPPIPPGGYGQPVPPPGAASGPWTPVRPPQGSGPQPPQGPPQSQGPWQQPQGDPPGGPGPQATPPPDRS